MKRIIKPGIALAIVILGLFFIISSFKKSSSPPKVANPPDLSEVPARVYGIMEPAEREVFVSPPITKRVIEVYVRERDLVKSGQRLCDLENSIEQEQMRLAQAKVALAQKNLEISLDELNRAKKLYKKRVDTEYKYAQAKFQKELNMKRLKVANHELDVAKAQLEQTVLRSPIDGIVYKFDVRLGETLSAGDNERIILGSSGLWVRLFIESFWKDKVRTGLQCKIFDSETLEYLGIGKIIKRAPYMGRRDFRTEDAQERFDTKFQEVILELNPEKENIPIGLSVVAEFK
jgi:multidrug efflux pump subunit AcrA (membrane-fusion protein)